MKEKRKVENEALSAKQISDLRRIALWLSEKSLALHELTGRDCTVKQVVEIDLCRYGKAQVVEETVEEMTRANYGKDFKTSFAICVAKIIASRRVMNQFSPFKYRALIERHLRVKDGQIILPDSEVEKIKENNSVFVSERGENVVNWLVSYTELWNQLRSKQVSIDKWAPEMGEIMSRAPKELKWKWDTRPLCTLPFPDTCKINEQNGKLEADPVATALQYN